MPSLVDPRHPHPTVPLMLDLAKLARVMRRLGVDNAGLARRLSIKESSAKAITTGQRETATRAITRVAKALGVQTSEITMRF